jgi:poly-gamma-glutamate synthesis protein (capsule biosynthesis protein)
VHRLANLSRATLEREADRIRGATRPGDLVVASLHWGGNWGWSVPPEHRRFARGLVERGGVDIVHGHSSHHPLGMEVHRGKLVLYGCGDFLNDYEGIAGHEEYRPDLTLMYFPRIDRESGDLVGLRMMPMRIRRFRLERASREDADWLHEALTRESRGITIHVLEEETGPVLEARVGSEDRNREEGAE